jgi:small nuclear ribonucleoprotein (snRNP)-like protein
MSNLLDTSDKVKEKAKEVLDNMLSSIMGIKYNLDDNVKCTLVGVDEFVNLVVAAAVMEISEAMRLRNESISKILSDRHDGISDKV